MFGTGNDLVTGLSLDGDQLVVVGTTEGSFGAPVTGLPGSGGFIQQYDLDGGASLASTATFQAPPLNDAAVAGADVVVAAADSVALVQLDAGVEPPAALLQVSPTGGEVPLTVLADASSSTPSDGISSYEFDFGDGTTVGPQTASSTNHQYTSAGVFTVTLTVVGNSGLAESATQDVTVTTEGQINNRPVANPATVTVPANDSVAITLTGSDLDGDAIDYDGRRPSAERQPRRFASDSDLHARQSRSR